jgi:hypothetical protein
LRVNEPLRHAQEILAESRFESVTTVSYDSPSSRTEMMSANKAITERILTVLRPYASNWSGTLGRGDLVIPQAEVPRLVREIAGFMHEIVERHAEAADLDVFRALMTSRGSPSIQDQVAELKRRFLILTR